MAEFIDKHESFLALVGFAGKGGRVQFVEQEGSEEMLVVFGDHILSGEINEQNLSFGKNGGEVQCFGELPEHRSYHFVLNKRFDAIKRRFDPFLASVELDAF